MAVAEGAQELPERGWRVHPAEQRRHPAVTQHIDVADAVRAGEHARHQCGDLPARVSALMPVDAYMLGHDAMQVTRLGQLHRRHEAGVRHEVRIVEHYADPAATL
jgi:hypothetical protein